MPNLPLWFDHLQKNLNPYLMIIIDDSSLHRSPQAIRSASSNSIRAPHKSTHWRIYIVSDQFEGKSKVLRHQKVLELIKYGLRSTGTQPTQAPLTQKITLPWSVSMRLWTLLEIQKKIPLGPVLKLQETSSCCHWEILDDPTNTIQQVVCFYCDHNIIGSTALFDVLKALNSPESCRR